MSPADRVRQTLADVNPAALFADGFDEAVIGYTVNQHHAVVVVYDTDKCIDVLMARDGMCYDDAEEFLSFNVLGAFVGANGPLFIRQVGAEEDF